MSRDTGQLAQLTQPTHVEQCDPIACGIIGTIYSLKNCPDAVVREIKIGDLPPDILKALETEIDILPRLRHENVLEYHQVLTSKDVIYICIPRYCWVLSAIITFSDTNNRPFPEQTIYIICNQIASALAYLHDLNKCDVNGHPLPAFIHRDLKPDSILVSADETQYVVADFGFCREDLDRGSAVSGVPDYAAPEALIFKKYTYASDIWSFGCIIYELITLKKPNFVGNRNPAEVFVDDWKPNLSVIKNKFLKEILRRIFVIKPEDRISARELVEVFETWKSSRYTIKELKRCESQARWNTLLINRSKALEENCRQLKEILKQSEVEVEGQMATITRLEHQSNESASRIRTLEKEIAVLKRTLAYLNHVTESASSTTLIDAIKNNNIEMAKLLISKAEEIGLHDSTGATALICAAQQGNSELVELLVTKEKRLQDNNGRTALMHAAIRGYLQISRILLPYEAEIKDSNGDTALILAAKEGHESIVDLFDSLNEEGVTALMQAVIQNDIEATNIFIPIQKGAQDSKGMTALMYAAANNCKNAVLSLLEYEKGMKDKMGRNALYHALKNGHMEITNILLQHDDPTDNAGLTALMRAAINNDFEMVKLLLPMQKCLQDTNGATALMHAAKFGRIEVVDLLVKYESKCRDSNDQTALMYAASNGYFRAVKTLLTYEVKLRDKYNNMAISLAIKNKHIEIVRLLLLYENDPSWTSLMCAAVVGDFETTRRHLSDKDLTDSNGRTALDLAKEAGQGSVVEVLDPMDEKGFTALMRAAAQGDLDTVKILTPVQKGMQTVVDGECSCKNDKHWFNKGTTALMIAAHYGYVDVVKELMKHEYSIHDSRGRTALMIAAAWGKTNAVKALIPLQKKMQTTGDGEYEADEQGFWFNKGSTALIFATRYCRLSAIKELIKHEGRMQDEFGGTALMWAARHGYTKAISLLIEKESRMQNERGWTALMWAVHSVKIEAVKLLVDHEKGMTSTRESETIQHNSSSLSVIFNVIPDFFPPGSTALSIAKKCSTLFVGDYKSILSILSQYYEERR